MRWVQSLNQNWDKWCHYPGDTMFLPAQIPICEYRHWVKKLTMLKHLSEVWDLSPYTCTCHWQKVICCTTICRCHLTLQYAAAPWSSPPSVCTPQKSQWPPTSSQCSAVNHTHFTRAEGCWNFWHVLTHSIIRQRQREPACNIIVLLH
jgi:hypothetical protein